MEQIAYIALGSNLGDRDATLRRAVMLMDSLGDVRVLNLSHLVETSPQGGPAGQDDYLNGVVEIATTLSPQELLAALGQIEQSLGRDRKHEQRWGPRTCDLDILLIDQQIIDTGELTVPHPRMHQRRFVLEPLAEIAPDARHPQFDKTIRQLLAELED